MKKILLLVTTALLSTNLWAGSCAQSIGNVSDLSDSVRQEMIVTCETAKLTATNQVTSNIDVDKLDQWSEISLKFAKALGVAAKEMGVAVNEFLPTPAGMITAGLVGWHVLGEDISSLFGLFIFLTIGSLIAHRFRKFLTFNGYGEGKDNLGRPIKLYKTYNELQDFDQFMTIVSWIIQIVGLLILGLTF